MFILNSAIPPSFIFLSLSLSDQSKVVGLSEANGKVEFITPIVNATVNTVLLQTCPEKFQCLLICPSGNVSVILFMCFNFYVLLGL